MFRRRRPLMRAAVVGGGAYVAGKKVAQRSAEQGQQENEQDERLATLEEQAPGHSGPSGPGRARRGTVDARSAEPARGLARAGRADRRRIRHRQGQAARHLGAGQPLDLDPGVSGSLEGAQDERAVQGHDQRRYPGLGARTGRRSSRRRRPTARRTWSTSCWTTWASRRCRCYGGPIETPNIDRIAADGIRYTQWHTTALCSPTRSCLLTGRNHTRNSMACITEAAVGFPNASGTIPPENGMLLGDPGRAGLEHLHGRQVAPVPDGRDERRLDAAELAVRPRVRALVRVPGRGDQPVVPGPGLRQPPGRPAEVAGGGLPPDRGPDRQGDRVHQGRQGGRAGQAVLPVLRARRRARAAPRLEGVGRQVQGPVRHGLRGDAGADPGPAEGDGHRPGRHRAAADQPDRHARDPHRARRPAVPAAGLHPAVGLAVRRGEAAVRPDGRGVRRVPGARRPSHRPAAGLPGGVRAAGEHAW